MPEMSSSSQLPLQGKDAAEKADAKNVHMETEKGKNKLPKNTSASLLPTNTAQKSSKTTQKHTTLICGDSLVKNVNAWKLSQKCSSNEEIFVKTFPGATVNDMESYVTPSVQRKPQTIILHCGTNDLRFNNKSEVQISEDIVHLAKSIQSNGIDVIVSELIARGDRFEGKRVRTNYILKDMCFDESITYIEHSNIEADKHLNRSQLHLNRFGDALLSDNLLKASRL